MIDVEVTIVARWRADREPTESEVRELVEDVWLGDLVDYFVEEV